MIGRFVILCLFLVSLPAALSAKSGGADPVSVTGVVYSDSKSMRMQGVLVKLCDSGASPISQSFTSDAGEFAFRGLERGPYMLTFEAAGYQKTEVHVDLSFESEKDMNISMKPAPASAASETSTAPIKISSHELAMPEGAREFVAAGKQKLYSEKNAAGALEDFQRAVATAPNYYEAYYQIGVALVALGKPADAEKSFRKSMDVSSDKFGDADVALGTLLMEQGKVEAGEESLRHGVSLNPNSWVGFFELGKLEMKRSHLDEALKMAEQARSLSPNSAVVYRLLANIHIQNKDYPALLEDIDAYVKLDPDSPAGVRAKGLRQQVQQQLADEKPSSVPIH